jgi:glycosyltransferase involved in cell wall biosynthesis
MINPLVSVVIPAYHADPFLSEALDSVRLQTYRHWELLVVEDGSQDQTETMVRAFARDMPNNRVQYLRHEQNCGLGATRNTGIRHSQGDFIALLDADDTWKDAFLEVFVQKLDETHGDIAFGAVQQFEHTTRREIGTYGPAREEMEHFASGLFRRNFISASAVVVRKRVFDTIGLFEERIRSCADYDLWIRAARTGFHFVYIGGIYGFYRRHPSSLSKNAKVLYESMAFVFTKHQDWDAVPLSVRLDRIAQVNALVGRLYRDNDPPKAVRHLLYALKLRPARLRVYYHLMVSFGVLLLQQARVRKGSPR